MSTTEGKGVGALQGENMDALNVRKKKEGRDDIGRCWNWMGTKGGGGMKNR